MAGTFKGFPFLMREYALVDCEFTMDGVSLNSGVGSSSVLTASRDVAMVESTTNARGDVNNIINSNKGGLLRFTLLKNSTVNGLLLEKYLEQEKSGEISYSTFSIKDPSDPIICTARNSWFVKQPDISKGNIAGEQTWEFKCHQLVLEENSVGFF